MFQVHNLTYVFANKLYKNKLVSLSGDSLYPSQSEQADDVVASNDIMLCHI